MSLVLFAANKVNAEYMGVFFNLSRLICIEITEREWRTQSMSKAGSVRNASQLLGGDLELWSSQQVATQRQ